jgi:ATP-binding cassette subfamily B protein
MPPHHTALRCAFLLSVHHGCGLEPLHLAAGNAGDILGSTVDVLKSAGLAVKVKQNCDWPALEKSTHELPFVAIRSTGHWVVVVRIVTLGDGAQALVILDPETEQSGPSLILRNQFLTEWSGCLIMCRRANVQAGPGQPFGFRWFLPEFAKHKKYFRNVAIAALMANIVSFATPLLLHVVIDKAVPYQAYNTLYFILFVFAVATAFEAIFNFTRQYLMLFATNKIDAQLASKTYSHLLGLPLPFFERTPSGIVARNMQQTEKVRNFLTGRLFQTALDAAFLPVLIALLLIYSVKLTAVVFAFSMAIAGVIGFLIPAFRYHLDQLYRAEGARQAHLVETMQGMRTIKSLSAEDVQQRSWDTKVLVSVRKHAAVGRIAAISNVTTTALEKLMQAVVIGLGAVTVFDGGMTIGALVAFTMISGRVSGPLVQMVTLVNEYQETALSIKMLGTIMNHPRELDRRPHALRPVLTGQVEFDRVTFRYPGAAAPALDNLSFQILEGQFIGIVGRSGSGKTTITRLIQGIHGIDQGFIRFDGVDMRHIDLRHLRRSMGVVLQESFLFRGTIAENIKAAKPDSRSEDIMTAARLAGADEFIERLPEGYNTFLEEGAANLSGGQRQRLSIARALITKPRLLIFDEATSALDPESEAIVQRNLTEIAKGRTILMVSHRLSSLVDADAILVLEHGRVLDFAQHEQLLDRCAPYAAMWAQQTRVSAGELTSRQRLMA